MSPELQRVAERAKREPEAKFHALAQLMDEQLLAGAYQRIRKDAAVGVDEVTKEQYGQDLQERLRDLHARMVAKKYRHQPIRRVHIPKDQGKTRPIGISTVEDKVVQNALSEVLGAIYEQDFMDCSYGFRPGRSAHDAVRALTEAVDSGEANFVLEIDLASYFDSIDRTMLMELLQRRVSPRRMPMKTSHKFLLVALVAGAVDSPGPAQAQGEVIRRFGGSCVPKETFEDAVAYDGRGIHTVPGRVALITCITDLGQRGRDVSRVEVEWVHSARRDTSTCLVQGQRDGAITFEVGPIQTRRTGDPVVEGVDVRVVNNTKLLVMDCRLPPPDDGDQYLLNYFISTR